MTFCRTRLPTAPDQDLPIREVPSEEWNKQLPRAEEACRLIDRHLDYEGLGRLLVDVRDYRPEHLCPEQRIQMVTDLAVVTT